MNLAPIFSMPRDTIQIRFPNRSHRFILHKQRLMIALLLPIAFGAGIDVALQITLNGQLERAIGGDSETASLVSFTLGALCPAVIALLGGGAVASLAEVSAQPLWSLLGGVLDAEALLCNVLPAPRMMIGNEER
jgi:transporter family-2 protein